MLLQLTIAALSIYFANSRPADQCTVEAQNKVSCGAGALDDKCIEAGCCWKPCEGCDESIPWCFTPSGQSLPACTGVTEKLACSSKASDETSCLSAGCCWEESNSVDDPWCFKPADSSTPEPVETTKFRLADSVQSPDTEVGRLEVEHEGRWGTVCDDMVDLTTAIFMCQQFGYSNGIMTSAIEGSGDIWLDDFHCAEGVSSVDECEHNAWGQHNCAHSEDTTLYCTNVAEEGSDGDVRLVSADDEGSGGTGTEGRLEMYKDGFWGTVCDDYLDHTYAKTACKQLGYQTGQIIANDNQGDVNSVILVYYDGSGCTGQEKTVSECQGNINFAGSYCNHMEDLYIRCDSEAENREEGEVKLIETADLEGNSGIVAVWHNGLWGTVCDDNFDHTDAGVVCKQLGFNYGVFLSKRTANPYQADISASPIYLDELACTGSEEGLAECGSNGWGNHDCSHFEDAAVECSMDPLPTEMPIPENQFAVRLYDPNNEECGLDQMRGQPSNCTKGLVLVTNSHYVEGSVCDDSFDDYDAQVVCRMLGHVTGSAVYYLYDQYTGMIALDDVQCRGNESNLADCRHTDWGNHNCGHYEDVAVQCGNTTEYETSEGYPTPTELVLEPYSVRIWDSRNPDCEDCSKGLVLVMNDEQEEGTVCDDYFDDTDAGVVCRQLGFDYGVALFYYENYHGRIALDDVQCTGNETNIGYCHHIGWENHNCQHSEDVSVECFRNEENSGSGSGNGSGDDEEYPYYYYN